MIRVTCILALLALAGCGDISLGGGNGLFGGREDETEFVLLSPEDGSVETLDGEGDELALDAEADATGETEGASTEPRTLGFSVISLGDASIPGLWLETPLVDSEQPGRVIGENGAQIAVTLRPSGGERNSGSRLSLEGYQALGISLAALPTVTVMAGG